MTTETVSRLHAEHGFASSDVWRRGGLSYVQRPGAEGYPSTATCDVWMPPSPMALPGEMCERVKAFALERCAPITVVNKLDGAPTTRPAVTAWQVVSHVEGPLDRCPLVSRLVDRNPEGAQLDEDIRDAVIRRMKAANERWWTFDLDHWTMTVKRYNDGGDHPAHADWTADAHSQGRKLSCSIPLSDPGDYEGGDFMLRQIVGPSFPALPLPKDQGTTIVFPPWAVHEVTPVTSGERWVLLVNGWGPRLR